MKKLSDANPSDFSMLLDATHKLSGFDAVEKVAQAFIDIVYEHFQKSLLLLRLFSSLPYSALPTQDQQLVNKKANDSGTMHLLKDRTPILTLLATRGKNPIGMSAISLRVSGAFRLYRGNMSRHCPCYPCNSKV